MNAKLKTFGFIGIALLGATSALGQQVKTDYDSRYGL